MKAKGVKSSVVKANIGFEDYVRCLREQYILKKEQQNIRSRLHVIRTEKEHKIALSPHDDKRHLVLGETDSLPWGHFSIRECDMTLRNGGECVCGQVSTCSDQLASSSQSASSPTPTEAATAVRKVVGSRVLKELQSAGVISRSRISNRKELLKNKSTTCIFEPLKKRVRIIYPD